jgi:hypothetical protein
VAVRFYVDADTLGLAHALCRIRGDVTDPGDQGGKFKRMMRPACVIADPETKDDVWLPIVANAGWLIITRDQNIRKHRAEIKAVMDNGARLVAIVGRSAKEKLDNFAILEIFMINWRRIEPLLLLPGPFVYTASRTGLSKVV